MAIAAMLLAFVITQYRARSAQGLERQAEEFVYLASALGRRYPSEVDAYFGPQDLDARRRAADPSPQALQETTRKLLSDLRSSHADPAARRSQLLQRVAGLDGLLTVLRTPGRLDFDQEARDIYDLGPTAVDAAAANAALRQLEALLPGAGSLARRVDSFRNRFVVPPERQAAVFERALQECRTRTLARWPLPAGEQMKIVWTHDVDAAWHRYEGRYRSTLQLNPAAVSLLSSMIDVACHEGYPGHHAQFVLAEMTAGRLPVEDTIVLRRSAIALLREGAADYGVDLVFPPRERLAFEHDVLFPLAGLDASLAEKELNVHRLVDELRANTVPILRAYRDRRLSAEAAGRALESSALVSSPAALLSFVDELGPYVLGYTVARDKVRGYVEASAQVQAEDPWRILRRILAQEDVRALHWVPLPAAQTAEILSFTEQ